MTTGSLSLASRLRNPLLQVANLRSPVRGLALMALGVTLFAIHNAVAKHLSAGYGTPQIVFLRHLFALAPIVTYLALAGGTALLRTRAPRLHLLRGLLGLAGSMGMYYAIGVLPLADSTAIAFSIPLFITALSVPLLGESVGWRRWLAVMVGFAGVIVVLRPGAGMVNAVSAIALVSCFALALSMILTRKMGRTEHSATVALYFTAIALTGAGPLAALDWIGPSLPDLGLFALMGLLAGAGVILVTQAYKLAPAATVAPLDYMNILWAAALGYLVWSEVPGWNVALGAAIVIASGLYIVHREVVRARAGNPGPANSPRAHRSPIAAPAAKTSKLLASG